MMKDGKLPKRYDTEDNDWNHGRYLHARAKSGKAIDDWYYSKCKEMGMGGNILVLFEKIAGEYPEAEAVITHDREFSGNGKWKSKSRTIMYMFVIEGNKIIARLRVHYDYDRMGRRWPKDTYEVMK